MLRRITMPTFKISCSWEVCGELEVDAPTFEEAWQKVVEEQEVSPLPTDTSYIDGSFSLDEEMSKVLNNINEDDGLGE